MELFNGRALLCYCPYFYFYITTPSAQNLIKSYPIKNSLPWNSLLKCWQSPFPMGLVMIFLSLFGHTHPVFYPLAHRSPCVRWLSYLRLFLLGSQSGKLAEYIPCQEDLASSSYIQKNYYFPLDTHFHVGCRGPGCDCYLYCCPK